VDYLGVSKRQIVQAAERLAVEGRYELAASVLETAGSRFAADAEIASIRRRVYLKLMEKNQNTDPFKFIIYSAQIGEVTPEMKIGTK
jgi:hypothetical protein